jgi:hypothetical protein
MTKTPPKRVPIAGEALWVIIFLNIGICFEFRASDFEFDRGLPGLGSQVFGVWKERQQVQPCRYGRRPPQAVPSILGTLGILAHFRHYLFS